MAANEGTQNDAHINTAVKKCAVETAALWVNRLSHQRLTDTVFATYA